MKKICLVFLSVFFISSTAFAYTQEEIKALAAAAAYAEDEILVFMDYKDHALVDLIVNILNDNKPQKVFARCFFNTPYMDIDTESDNSFLKTVLKFNSEVFLLNTCRIYYKHVIIFDKKKAFMINPYGEFKKETSETIIDSYETIIRSIQPRRPVVAGGALVERLLDKEDYTDSVDLAKKASEHLDFIDYVSGSSFPVSCSLMEKEKKLADFIKRKDDSALDLYLTLCYLAGEKMSASYQVSLSEIKKIGISSFEEGFFNILDRLESEYGLIRVSSSFRDDGNLDISLELDSKYSVNSLELNPADLKDLNMKKKISRLAMSYLAEKGIYVSDLRPEEFSVKYGFSRKMLQF